MQMDVFLGGMILLMLVGSGGYALYTYFRLRKSWGFFDNKFLLPGNCPPEECLDPEGFLEYIHPRLLILGVLCCVAAILCVPVMLPDVAELIGLGGTLYTVINYVVPLMGFGVFVWYMFCQNRAAKRFWGWERKK